MSDTSRALSLESGSGSGPESNSSWILVDNTVGLEIPNAIRIMWVTLTFARLHEITPLGQTDDLLGSVIL